MCPLYVPGLIGPGERKSVQPMAERHQGPPSAHFAAYRIRIADGLPQRIHDKGQQHMPGEEAWLVGEWRPSGEQE